MQADDELLIEDSWMPITWAAPANQNVANKIPREKPEAAILVSQVKAEQQSDRMVDSEQNKTFKISDDDKRYKLQLNEKITFVWLRLITSCTPPVNTVPDGRQLESSWGGRQGLELSAELAIIFFLL